MKSIKEPSEQIRELFKKVLKTYTGYEEPTYDQFVDYCRINPNAAVGSSMAGGNDYSKRDTCGAMLGWSRDTSTEGCIDFVYTISVDIDEDTSYYICIDHKHPFSKDTDIYRRVR